MALEPPGPTSPEAGDTHRRLILIHTILIAFAGLASTINLSKVLAHFSESARAARHALFALIGGNLFAGAQIGFILRPIFGQPGLKIQFLRPDAMSGNFYESVWWALKHAF